MIKSDGKTYIESPIEGIFDIEPGSTLSEIQNAKTSIEPSVEAPTKDEDDVAVDSQLSTVYDYAIEAFESQTEQVQIVDPKFAARNAEVAALYLRIALDATSSKAKIKLDREKDDGKNKGPSTVNNNLIVADRNELLRAMLTKNIDVD